MKISLLSILIFLVSSTTFYAQKITLQHFQKAETDRTHVHKFRSTYHPAYNFQSQQNIKYVAMSSMKRYLYEPQFDIKDIDFFHYSDGMYTLAGLLAEMILNIAGVETSSNNQFWDDPHGFKKTLFNERLKERVNSGAGYGFLFAYPLDEKNQSEIPIILEGEYDLEYYKKKYAK